MTSDILKQNFELKQENAKLKKENTELKKKLKDYLMLFLMQIIELSN